MKISPLDIQHQKFRIIFRGYDSRDVDSFMELIYNEFEDLIKEKDDLKTELKDKTNLTDELLEREKTIKETMMTAQQVTQDMKSNAKKEADLIKSEAEIQGENIINNAHKRLAALLDDITEVKRQKAQFIASLRGLVDTHGKMLEVDEREDEGLRDIEERLNFLKRGR